MIKRCGLPGGGRMTRLAVMAECAGLMVWIRGLREIDGMALVAVSVVQTVVPILVTRLAGGNCMFAVKRKCRSRVVEC